MKNTTIVALYNYLTANAIPELSEAYEDLTNEVNKVNERKTKAREIYDDAKPIVFAFLKKCANPMTNAEIYHACEKQLPEGFTSSKLSYALRNYWVNEVIAHEPTDRRSAMRYTIKAE